MNDLEERAMALSNRAYNIENVGFLDRIRAAQVLRADTGLFISELLSYVRALLKELEDRAHG